VLCADEDVCAGKVQRCGAGTVVGGERVSCATTIVQASSLGGVLGADFEVRVVLVTVTERSVMIAGTQMILVGCSKKLPSFPCMELSG
jgi:hypothetical protein